MIEIYECTDCKHCVAFGEYPVVCVHEELPADEMYKYFPLNDNVIGGDVSADKCIGFEEGNPHEMPSGTLSEAEALWNQPGGSDEYCKAMVTIWKKSKT